MISFFKSLIVSFLKSGDVLKAKNKIMRTVMDMNPEIYLSLFILFVLTMDFLASSPCPLLPREKGVRTKYQGFSTPLPRERACPASAGGWGEATYLNCLTYSRNFFALLSRFSIEPPPSSTSHIS